MPRRYTKAVIWEGGKMRTYSNVRTPALLPSYKNNDVYLMRVGFLFKRTIEIPKSKVWTSPKGELDKPDIVIGCTDKIYEDMHEDLEALKSDNEQLERQFTIVNNQVEAVYKEMGVLRTTSAEHISEQVAKVMEVFTNMQKALRPAPKKGGRI